MGEASASFGNSQNYDGEENPSKSMENNSGSSNNNRPKKKSNNKRGSKGPPPDDCEKGSSSKRGSTPREPKYKCELCSFSTAYLYSINRHALKVHKDSVMQEDGSIKACFEKLETKKEPVTLPSLFSSPPSTSAPSQEFDGLQEFNNIVDSLGVSTSTQWSDPSNTAEQLGPIKFATTDGTQINIFRTDYVPFGQNDSHFITFEKADESSATVGDTLLNGYLGNTLQVAAPQEPKFLHLSTSSSLGNSSQHSQQQTLEVKTENDASNGARKQKSNSLSPKKFGKSKKRKSSLGTSDSGNDDLSSDGKGGPEKKKRKQNAPISLIKSTVSKCPLCSFSSKYPSNTGRHFQSVHKAECKEVLEGRLTLEGIVKKEERVEKQQSPPKKKRPPAKKPVELKIPQVGAPSSQEYSDNNSSMASQNPPGPTPAEQLQQFVQNEHLELYAGPDTDNIEPIASFIDSLLSGCVGPNEWGLPPVEGAYPVETTHFVHNTGETVAQSHSVMQLEPQLNGMTNSYLQPYNQVQPVQVQIQPQQLQQYQHPTPVSEAHPTPGYHPVPQIQSVTPVAPTTQTPKKPVKNNKSPAQTLSAEEQKQAALNRRREKRREQRLKKLAEKNSTLQQQQQQQQTSSTPHSQAAPSHAGISIDNPATVVVSDAGVDNSLRNEVRAAVEGTYETLVSSHSLTSSQYQTSYGTGVDAPMSTVADNRVNSSGTNSLQPTTMNVQMGYQMASGMHSIMDTVQVAAVGAPVDTPAVTPAGAALPVATLEWSSQLYHPAPNQAIPVNDGSTAYTTLNVAAMNISDVHTYLPIDFNELSQSTTTLQPLDPTIVITNSATSPNAPVLSIPQPVVPLSVDENSFFDASLRPTEIQQPQASTTQQQVFSDNSVNHQHSDSRNGDDSSSNSISPRIKTERTQEDIEAAKQDRLAKRREKYRQQQELKKKGLQPPPTTDNKPQKKPVPPEVLEARRKRELERRKEKRKQLAEQKRLLQQQQKQQSQTASDGGQVLGSKSVPITPVGVTSEARAPDLPSVSSSGSSVPSSTNTDTTLSSDNSGPGIMTPPEAQKVLCGESGALTTSGKMKKEASSLGISNVVIVQEQSSFLGSAVKEPNSMPGHVDQVRETIEDNLPQQFRRSTATELNSIISDDHQTSTTAASGVTTSDLKPVSGLEGSVATNFPIMDMGFQTDSEGNAQLTEHSSVLAPFNFVRSHAEALGSAQISQGREKEILEPSAEGQRAAQTLDLFSFPSEVSQSSSGLVVSVALPPWEPQLRDIQIPAFNGAAFEQGWDVKPIPYEKVPEACVDEPILPSSSAYVTQFNSSGKSLDLTLSVSAAAIDIKPVMSQPPLKKSRGDLTPAEIEAKKMKQREKQREYNKMRKLKKNKKLAEELGEQSVKAGSGMTTGNGKHGDDSNGLQEPTRESLKEKKRLINAAQQRERRRKSKEQKIEDKTVASGTSTGAEEVEGEEKGKKVKFIKVDHSPQVQNCPDCDFQTDTHYKLMVHKTVHDALNNMPPFVKSIIDATGKVDYLLKYQPDRDPFEGTKVVVQPTTEVRKDSV